MNGKNRAFNCVNIKDNLDNNTKQLERISNEQDKIINDLDFIEENLNERIYIYKYTYLALIYTHYLKSL